MLIEPLGSSIREEYPYYLEGNYENYDSQYFAMPGAYEALASCQHLIEHSDSDEAHRILARSLKLCGVIGLQEHLLPSPLRPVLMPGFG